MEPIINNQLFKRDYEKLKQITLNPEKHTAKTAYDHTEMVVKRIRELALSNQRSIEEIEMLENLAHIHDIGKISGNANPDESVELASKYGINELRFINLIKYHDINLPWYISFKKGQEPTNKAWNKLTNSVNIFHLCLFMIADRVDSPQGWKFNEPLIWFLNELKRRNLLDKGLIIDDQIF